MRSMKGSGAARIMSVRRCCRSQATEAGTVYRVDEIRQLAGIAHAHGVAVHVDGARIANALGG